MVAPAPTERDDTRARRRIRRRALVLTAVALAFYVGFIALTVYRSHHVYTAVTSAQAGR